MSEQKSDIEKAEQLIKDLNSEITEMSQDIQTQHNELLECYAKIDKLEIKLSSIDDVIKKFEPVFKIKPVTENLVEIIEAFKKAYFEIEKLKK